MEQEGVELEIGDRVRLVILASRSRKPDTSNITCEMTNSGSIHVSKTG